MEMPIEEIKRVDRSRSYIRSFFVGGGRIVFEPFVGLNI
jgi:hypothetical protein